MSQSEPITVEFLCPHCACRNVVDGEWFDEQTKGKCVFCAQVIDFLSNDFDYRYSDEDEADDGVIPTPSYYLAPAIRCDNCSSEIELFYPNLPETDQNRRLLLQGQDPLTLPPEGWRGVFGCLACGHVKEYGFESVMTKLLLKLSRGSHQSGRGLLRVEFPCAERHCKAPFSMHVDIQEQSLNAAVSIVRGAHFFHTLPCGHALMPVPEKFYEVHPVTRRLW